MERVEPLQIIKVDHCTLVNILRSVTLDIRSQTTFHKVRMSKGEVMRKLAQKCHEHIYVES